MYVLRRGLRLRRVCFMASQTVRKPKPRVKPAARDATWMSEVDAMLGSEAAHVARRTVRRGKRWKDYQKKTNGKLRRRSPLLVSAHSAPSPEGLVKIDPTV